VLESRSDPTIEMCTFRQNQLLIKYRVHPHAGCPCHHVVELARWPFSCGLIRASVRVTGIGELDCPAV
jgi:hypothetical protein